MIPPARPDIGPEEIEAVSAVLRSGMLAQGKRVAELEQRWATYCGAKHALAVSNGTVALMSLFAGLGIGPGDEVITVGFTFAATANSILYTGATPVFVDIEADSYLIDAGRIGAAITPRTRAICPVSLYGLIPDMDAILAIADRYGLPVVEDACQAHGATYRGRRAGSFGYAAFSLYGTKNMTTGEGGFVTTEDDRVADWIRLYRNQGMRARYQYEMLGFNFRMTDIAAAIGLVQLDKLDRNTARRQAIAAAYDRGLVGLPVRLPVTPDGRTHVYHQYTVGVGPARDSIVADLQGAGIGVGIYYPQGTHREAYILERGIEAKLPVTDAAAAACLSLPIYPGLTDAEQSEVVEAVRSAVLRHAEPAAIEAGVAGGAA
ncbi:MAG: DegT/DnrJ/EryC1/StrS family aminotransferase [Candidatus Limnocylindrales bacterium]